MVKVSVDAKKVLRMIKDIESLTVPFLGQINRERSEMTQKRATPFIPSKTGTLRRSGRTTSIGRGNYALIYKRPESAPPITYQSPDIAANSERGKTSAGGEIKKWTTPGTGSKWMERTADWMERDGTYRRIAERWIGELLKSVK
jgi:hypothetical protein